MADISSQGQPSRRSRSNSRPRRPDPLHRIYSAQYLDDHSVYHHDDDNDACQPEEVGGIGSNSSTETSKSTKGDTEKGDYEQHELDEPVKEVIYGIPDERDEEAGPPALEKQQTRASVKDPNLITWEGPDDPANPKNWTFGRKWAATLTVSMFTFVSPVSSSMVAPGLGTIARDLGIASSAEQSLVLSIFVLAYAIGPLAFGPLSEVYGRVPVLQWANLFFLAWNIGCGFAQTKGQMLAFRFLSGLGGSAPLGIGGGVLSDLFSAEERGKSLSIYSLAPLLGPAVGPIAGAWISMKTTWRWGFRAVSIADALIQVAGLFFLQETYAPKILKIKADKVRNETGNAALHTEFESPDKTLPKLLRTSMIRPFRLIGTQPIIQLLALYMAYLYGLMYLVLSTFPSLWTNVYHESIGVGGLNYISLGLGFFLGTQITAPINDRIYAKLKKRNNNVGRPEFRVPLMVPASLLVPIGLFWYGWSAQAEVHWIMPNIGACVFAAGTIVGFQCIQTYIVDAYTRYAASGVGAAAVLRSLAGFGFPLFAPAMYRALGYGWGNSVLGFIAIVIGFPAPVLLWLYGAKLRARSQFAAGS